MKEKSMEIRWINAAKLIAILAVMTDHTHQRVYTNYRIAWASYFAVTVFVFLSGITSFYSCRRHKGEPLLQNFIRRAGKILVPYAAATFLYQIAENRFWNFKVYVDYLLNFNASGPFYFVIFYVQLLAVSPFLYAVIVFINEKLHKWYRWVGFFLSACAVLIVAILCFNYTCIKESFYGGGKYLLGSSYLLIYYFGIIFGGLNIVFPSIKAELISFLTAGIVTVAWYEFTYSDSYRIDSYLPLGSGSNPPGITLIVYGVLVIWLLFSLFSYMEDCKYQWMNRIVDWLYQGGKYSIYIFLYHRLVLDYFLPRVEYRVVLPEGIIKVIIYFGLMIAFPILGKKCYSFIRKGLRLVG